MMMGDEEAFKEMSQVVDAARPQALSHYLYFADEADSRLAGELLKSQDFTVVRRMGADGVNWLVYATHFTIPSLDNIERLRKAMEGLADTFRGEYDGWEIATAAE